MIYSEDINKVCGLCVKASRVKGSETHMRCALCGEYVPISRSACKKFEYDIFKRRTGRRKKSAGKFKPEDFIL